MRGHFRSRDNDGGNTIQYSTKTKYKNVSSHTVLTLW